MEDKMFEKIANSENMTVKERRATYLRLYFATVKDFTDDFYPPERQNEIDSVTNKGLKAQKKTSWKLLEYAIQDRFNKSIEEFFFKKINGKWLTEKFYFSISHSADIVLVGLSDDPIGVDIECQINFLKKVKKPIEFFDKIATAHEKNLYKSPSIGRLLKLWTGKESNFKRSDLSLFIPKKVEIDVNDTKYACLVKEGENFTIFWFDGCEIDCDLVVSKEANKYMLSVCSDCKTDCKLYFVDLSNNTKVPL